MNNNINIQPNRDLLDRVLETNLTEEQRKKLNLNKDNWKDDRIEPIKTATDQEKIDAYDKLEVKDLPEDWKKELARIAQLEENQLDYEAKKEELKGWTEAFGEKKPNEVQEEINNLEEKQKQTEQELNNWKEKFELTEKQLKEWQQTFLNQEPPQVKQKIEETEQELNEWKGTWSHQELSAIKEEWEVLNKRPDITINEEEFYDDYARRIAPDQLKKLREEFIKNENELIKVRTEKENLNRAINEVLENWRTIRYMLYIRAQNPAEAEKLIEKLLNKTVRHWEEYLKGISNKLIPPRTEEEMALDLSFKQAETKKSQAEQILEWIKEALETREWQKLFERWSGGKEYNKEYDFDGSLYLLKRYLEKCSPTLPASSAV